MNLTSDEVIEFLEKNLISIVRQNDDKTFLFRIKLPPGGKYNEIAMYDTTIKEGVMYLKEKFNEQGCAV